MEYMAYGHEKMANDTCNSFILTSLGQSESKLEMHKIKINDDTCSETQHETSLNHDKNMCYWPIASLFHGFFSKRHEPWRWPRVQWIPRCPAANDPPGTIRYDQHKRNKDWLHTWVTWWTTSPPNQVRLLLGLVIVPYGSFWTCDVMVCIKNNSEYTNTGYYSMRNLSIRVKNGSNIEDVHADSRVECLWTPPIAPYTSNVRSLGQLMCTISRVWFRGDHLEKKCMDKLTWKSHIPPFWYKKHQTKGLNNSSVPC